MSSMVSGYSGIIAPPNLATNGGFGIHQRGGHNWSPLKGGDYVADCWQVHTHTDVDYLEVWHGVPTDGSVNKPIYRGYGKKGQEINIKCRDVDPYGEHYGMFTSQVTIEKYSAVKSVPLKVDCFPKRDHSYSTVLNESKILGGANNSVSTVTIVDAPASDGLMYGGFVRVYLQEDGEFSFIIMNYMELAGAFKNPPKYAPVPYADDLARCQRYYQTGEKNFYGLPRDTGSNYELVDTPNFSIPMVSNPNRTIDVALVYEDGAGYGVNHVNSYSHFATGFNNTFSEFWVRKPNSGAKPSTMRYTWTAEVV